MLTKYRLLLLMGVVTACLGCGDTQRPSAPPIPEPNQTKPLESLGQREGLPTDLKCQDDYHPTLWEGRVIEFKRDNKKTEIEIKADWDAHYKGWLHNSEAGNPPLNLFRINGEPFKPTDWNIVESEKNKVRPNLRAKVWVCTDKVGKNPIIKRIDWQGQGKPSRAVP